MTDNNHQDLSSGTVSIWPMVWKYGLIIAAFRVGYKVLFYATGLAAATGPGLIGIIGALVLLVVALKRFRVLNGGYIRYGHHRLDRPFADSGRGHEAAAAHHGLVGMGYSPLAV